MLMRIPWVVLVLGGLMRLGRPWIVGRFVLRLSPWVVCRLGLPRAGCLRLRLLGPWVVGRLGRLGRPWMRLRRRFVLRLSPWVAGRGVLLLLSPWVGLALILLMLPRVLSFNRAGGAGENCK